MKHDEYMETGEYMAKDYDTSSYYTCKCIYDITRSYVDSEKYDPLKWNSFGSRIGCSHCNHMVTNLSNFPVNMKTFICWNNNHNDTLQEIPDTFRDLEFVHIVHTIKFHKISKKCTKLKHLCLRACSVSEIPDTFEDLIYLECNGTNVVKLPKKLVKLSIKDGDFSKNLIKELPKEYVNLKYLGFSSDINEIPNTYTKLETLDCSKSSISSIPDHFLNLKVISCWHTPIKMISSNFINLTTLYCSNTQILELPDTLVNLVDLSCSDIKITKIPDTYIELEKLKISKTNIRELPKTLTKLKVIECLYTKLKSIPEEYTELEFIKCDASEISYLSPTFTKIYKIECSHTKSLHVIPKYKNLRMLFCNNSNVVSIPILSDPYFYRTYECPWIEKSYSYNVNYGDKWKPKEWNRKIKCINYIQKKIRRKKLIKFLVSYMIKDLANIVLDYV